ncbi:serine--tRNA ligase [Candidatus Woesearchaeota archaeon]|jgi:seryl-tRNA synthetase|nr:serine--tRNA ligase [Candidatus Woesearchaeota archaeon]MBT6336108.1 serine--tRNA ligase [Candidatus Woesearchaeota archaeon]MBT7927945.1 serine--tRNA ligase [Candidatus Woesearchaeota archaeon]
MIDIKLIRENPEIVKNDLRKRKDSDKLKWVDQLVKKDKDWRSLQFKVQDLKKEKNQQSIEVGKAKKAKNEKKAAEHLKKIPTIDKKIEKIEFEQQKLRDDINHYLMRLPNILHESVPQGDSDEENQTAEHHGSKPNFNFKPKSHVDLLEELGIADLERAAKIAGSRFYFLKGDLALLELALQKYGVDFMIKKSYTLISPPFMMNRKAYEGVTDLGDFEDVMYKVEGEDLYLIATSEHPLTAQFMNEILEEKDMPIKLAGNSTCFRKEAGSHGKDTKGIFRVHQFNKIEQVIVCSPEQSWKLHEELLKNAKEFFESLGLHFRIMNICTGDIGTVAAKKYDIEAWMPAQETYREVVSCSNCTDYQARRLKIRYRGKDKAGKETKIIPHTLNSTLVATGRALVAILENYQDKEGNIKIPKVLQPYMNNQKVIKKQ